jgi:hypothetical protein
MQDSLLLLQNSSRMQTKRLSWTELQACWNYYHARIVSCTFLIKHRFLVGPLMLLLFLLLPRTWIKDISPVLWGIFLLPLFFLFNSVSHYLSRIKDGKLINTSSHSLRRTLWILLNNSFHSETLIFYSWIRVFYFLFVDSNIIREKGQWFFFL